MTQGKRITFISIFVLLVAFGTYMFAARPFSSTKDPVAVDQGSMPVQQVAAAESTAPNANQKTTIQQQNKVSVVTPKTQTATSSSSTKNCTAGDLEGRLTLQDLGSTVAGAVTLTARPGITCTIAGYPIVSIGDKRGTLSGTTNYLGNAANMTLKSGQSTTSRVVWGNWCGRSVSDLSVRVTLSGDRGYLLIPAISTAGKAQSMKPMCIDDHTSSTVSVTGFAK